MSEQTTRREFLKDTGIVAGAIGVLNPMQALAEAQTRPTPASDSAQRSHRPRELCLSKTAVVWFVRSSFFSGYKDKFW
jgi:hypothetical protein